jgi:hypothetical protein
MFIKLLAKPEQYINLFIFIITNPFIPMRKSTLCRIILTGFLCITLSAARAQYVAIPDTNFGNWLNTEGYSADMAGNSTVGWQLNISSADVQTTTTIICDYSNISDLTGIENFPNLTTLWCGENNLTSLPYIPTLRYLYMSDNYFSLIPNLSNVLDTLICENNDIYDLSGLPNSLLYLNCSNNYLQGIYGYELPSSLQYLD